MSTEPGQTTKKESLYLKGILTLLLVVVIAATALNITAFAYSDHASGTYKGKNYSATLSVTMQTYSCNLTYQGGGNVDLVGTVKWRDDRKPNDHQATGVQINGKNGNARWNENWTGTPFVVEQLSLVGRVAGKPVCSLDAKAY